MPDRHPAGADALPDFHAGFDALADAYDAFIVDIWGVLHNGETVYPGVLETLRRLRAMGRQVCLLSNAPRRADTVAERLKHFGVFRGDAYDHVMSSGEATYIALRDRPDDFHRALGRTCVHIGPDRDLCLHRGLDYQLVERVEDAAFLLNSGPIDWEETIEDHLPVLEPAARAGLPMVCANPDLVVVLGDRLVLCAGTFARAYEELGGQVVYHGKPHADVYERCFELLDAPGRDRVLAIGDGLRTDIKGANGFGIDSLLITRGIHAEEVGAGPDGKPDPAKLAAMMAKTGARPTAVAPVFAFAQAG